MANQILGSVTSYLADLTTKLSNLVKTENPQSLPQTSFSTKYHHSKSHINPKYKKLDHWNYLQYFDFVLNLDSTHPIRLEKRI